MSHNSKLTEIDSALSAIRNLTTAQTKAERQIADCLSKLASEEGMLNSLLAEPKSPTNQQYLESAKEACQEGIKAWQLSIAAYQNDIDTYKSEICAIQKRIPEARLDH